MRLTTSQLSTTGKALSTAKMSAGLNIMFEKAVDSVFAM